MAMTTVISIGVAACMCVVFLKVRIQVKNNRTYKGRA